MRDRLIRWKLDDYRILEQAVNKFNRKIKRLTKLGSTSLPEPVDFVNLRKSIKSRGELNRILRSLKAFSVRGAEELVTLTSGEVTSKWEYIELKKARARAKANLTREANKIIKMRNIQLGMGDERLQEIEDTIESLYELENRKGYEYKRVKERILRQGSLDVNLKRAITFRTNFMESLKQASALDGYNKLIKKLESIKNPVDFYEYVSGSNIAMDFGVWYKETGEGDKISYGAFSTSQEMFDVMLDELGIY